VRYEDQQQHRKGAAHILKQPICLVFHLKGLENEQKNIDIL
jgi:hypothetical protein